MSAISIVIPTLNESENIALLVKRIYEAFAASDTEYEIIFIDDKSRDATLEEIKKVQIDHPVRYATKVGLRGKAFSLLQGFAMAKHDTICMIDADLQYPPEAILPMYHMMEENGVDLIVTERVEQETSKLRQLSSKVFNFIFARLLFGFNYDSQSGLKVFKKTVVKKAKLNPTPWSFDLEFIVRALENNFKILSYKIPFSKRFGGETKVHVLKLTYELAKASLKLRATSSQRKVRKAYQASLRVSERLGGAMIVPMVGLLAMVLAAPSVHASVLLAVDSVDTTVLSVTLPVVSPVVQSILPSTTNAPSTQEGSPLATSPSGPAGLGNNQTDTTKSTTYPMFAASVPGTSYSENNKPFSNLLQQLAIGLIALVTIAATGLYVINRRQVTSKVYANE